MNRDLVIVTGASRGLGLAITKTLAANGFHVVGVSRKSSDEIAELSATNFPSGGSVSFRTFDLTKLGEIHDFVREITAEHGHVYGLVNNAAVGHDGVLATMHDSQVEALISLNLTATILITKYVLRSMLLLKKGRIVNISSIIAATGFNGLSVYAAAKAGLIGFTRSLAREVGRAGITVNAVSPGYMETDMTSAISPDKLATITRRSPLGRLATTEEVASVVSFLMGPGASAITGATYTVDAGSTA